MTCRIRAGEVARPQCRGFTPRVARFERTSVPATRLARVLHSCRSTPVDRSSGRRQDSASARIAPPLRRGLVVSQGSWRTEERKSQRNRGFVVLLTTHPFGWTLLRSRSSPDTRRAPDQRRKAQPGLCVPSLTQAVRARGRSAEYADGGYAIRSVSARRRTFRAGRRARDAAVAPSTVGARHRRGTSRAAPPVRDARRTLQRPCARSRPARRRVSADAPRGDGRSTRPPEPGRTAVRVVTAAGDAEAVRPRPLQRGRTAGSRGRVRRRWPVPGRWSAPGWCRRP